MEKLIDSPLFDVSADGRIALALNFGRLARARPGYGYSALADPFASEWLPREDGITILDVGSGSTTVFVSLATIAALQPETARDRFHYLNAAFLSPSGRRFCVLHKWLVRPDRVDRWQVRAVVGDTDGRDLRVVPLPGAASHSWWIDDDQIAYTVGWQRVGDGAYFHYHVPSRVLTPLHPAAPSVDGHPSLHVQTNTWITDTYPDMFGEQALEFLRTDGTRRTLARLAVAPRYAGEWRCDLHPRWGRDGRTVIIDSTHEGSRAIYEVPVADLP